MIELLTASQKRRLQLILTLAHADQWVPLKKLSERIRASIRVLQDDLTFFKESFVPADIQTSNKGIRLRFNSGYNLQSLYQFFLNDSKAFQLMEWVFLKEGVGIPELADHLAVSVPTIYRMIDQINRSIAPFDFQIEKNPCRIVGKEERIRYFFYQYFDEKYSYLNYPFVSIDEETFDTFLNFFIDLTEIPADFAFYNIFKITSSVNLIRYRQNHFVSTEEIRINFDEIIPSLDVYMAEFKQIEEKLQVKISTGLINQIFTPYVQEGFSLNAERFYAKAEENRALKENIAFLNQILTGISDQNDISLSNKDRVIFALNNAAHLEYQEPQSGYILYNKNKYFARDVQRNFPKFYEDLYEGMKAYREYLNKPTTEVGIYFFIYTLFSFWENLIPELQKQFKKVQVVILSDQHVRHAQMLKDFILFELGSQVEVDIFTKNIVKRETLEALDFDLILMNFPLTSFKDKRSVYVENVPVFHDLVKIQAAVHAIFTERFPQLAHSTLPAEDFTL